MSKILKAGVIGAGVFGGYHAGKYVQSGRAKFIGVYDIDLARACAAAEKHASEPPNGARGFDDLSAFLAAVDIVTIASPAQTHFDMASAALKAGKSVLIEKPIAQTLDQANALIALAKARNCVVAVGHQERAVFEAMGLLDIKESPLHISASRLGRVSERGTDVSVTLDLLIHDADLVMALMPGAFKSVSARGTSVYTHSADDITADIVFESGATASLTAGRTADEITRAMRIEYASGVISLDFVNRDFSNSTPYALNVDFANTAQGKDPLGANVERFIDAVFGETDMPLVSGEGGARALQLALAIDKAAGF